MCVFKPEHFGKPLHETIIGFFKDYTTKQDRDEIAKAHNISGFTMKRLCNGSLNLTKRTSGAIQSLMSRAVENCGNIKSKSSEDEKTIQEIITVGVAEVLD